MWYQKVCNCRQYCSDLVRSHQCSTAYTPLVPRVYIHEITQSMYMYLQVYVQYMKFCRRTEGIKSARNVFKLAREDARCSHQVYVSAALMEYNISKVSYREY